VSGSVGCRKHREIKSKRKSLISKLELPFQNRFSIMGGLNVAQLAHRAKIYYYFTWAMLAMPAAA